MSWNIKSIGPRAAVKAAVLAVYGMPLSLKMAIVDVIDTPPIPVSPGVTVLPVQYDSVLVHSYGHVGDSGSASIGKLEVELFTAAVIPEPAAPIAAPVTAPVAVVEAGAGSTTEKFADQGEPGPGV